MFGYYKSLLIASRRRKSLYFATALFILAILGVGLNIFVRDKFSEDENFTELKMTIYIISIPTINILFYSILWYLFYKDIYNNSIGNSMEILSFTSGLTRKKIFFAKLLSHLTLSSILAFLVTISFFIISLNLYSPSNFKIWLFAFSGFIVSIGASVVFFVMMFFCDTLSRKPRKKLTLALSFIFGSVLIYSLAIVFESGMQSVFIDNKAKNQGFDDFQDISFLNKDSSISQIISFSDKKQYLSKTENDQKIVNKDLELYKKYTNDALIIHLSANALNLFNIIENSQGIEKPIPTVGKIFNYHNNLPSEITNSLYVLKLNNNDKMEELYFKIMPWKYELLNKNLENYKKEQEEIEVKLNTIISLLKTNDEFNKTNPEWEKISIFLKPEIDKTFNISTQSNKYGDQNSSWISVFAYIKALENNQKNLQFSDSESGKKEKELFYENFVNSQEIFAYRVAKSTNQYMWISLIFVAIIMIGMGYWTIKRYEKMDII